MAQVTSAMSVAIFVVITPRNHIPPSTSHARVQDSQTLESQKVG